MRFQVPQFIEVEDKIFGPLTIKQFIYLLGGAGLSFIIYSFIGNLYISAVFIIPVVAFALAYYLLSLKLKTYINFQANLLLNPIIRNLSTLIILVVSVVFYLSVDQEIKLQGFQIPDSLIETSLKFAAPQVKGIKIAQVPNITPEQLEFIKKNPELLRQQGLDPAILDSAGQAQQKTATTNSRQVHPAHHPRFRSRRYCQYWYW